MVMEESYLAAKAKIEELSFDSKDLLKKISDAVNKVSKSEKLQSKAERTLRPLLRGKKL